MKTKIVLFNGPPNVGKDAMSDACVDYFYDDLYMNNEGDAGFPAVKQSFKTPMYRMLAEIYGLTLKRVLELCRDRDLKDTFCEEFASTPRQAMIFLSERVMKPNYGDDYFGRQAASGVKLGFVNFFADSGFISETLPLVAKFGSANILLVHMHRENCTFEQDSRDYLDIDSFINFYEFQNNEPIEVVTPELFERVQEFVDA